MTKKILILDDEQPIRSMLSDRLSEHGYACMEAADSKTALSALRQDRSIKIALVDIRMPGISGLDFIAELRCDPEREVEVIIMTGHGGVDEAIQALRLGARDFLQKPFGFRELLDSITKCEQAIREQTIQESRRQDLERSAAVKAERVRELVGRVDAAQAETVTALAIAAEHRDDDTGDHIQRIGNYASFMARRLGWGCDEIEQLRLAAMLHDVGKIGIPDTILLKPEPLTHEERDIMRSHTVIGHRITGQSSNRIMNLASVIALSHHELWDGSGYPNKIVGEEIAIEARIVALADTYDALRWKENLSHQAAVSQILNGNDRVQPGHFDPRLLEILECEAESFAAIFNGYDGKAAEQVWSGQESIPIIGGATYH